MNNLQSYNTTQVSKILLAWVKYYSYGKVFIQGYVKTEASKEVGDVKTEAVEAAEAVIEKDTIMGGKSIAYSQLTATLVKAIQELTARVVALEG